MEVVVARTEVELYLLKLLLQQFGNVFRLEALAVQVGGDGKQCVARRVEGRLDRVLYDTYYESYGHGLHGNIVVDAKQRARHGYEQRPRRSTRKPQTCL